MNICFDVGNSTIGIGVYENNILKERMSFNTDVKLTEDEFYHLFKNKINELDINLDENGNILMSDVLRLTEPFVYNYNKLKQCDD